MSYRLFVVLVVTGMLGGCGVPDLVAHGVKAYEKRGETSQPSQTAQPDAPPSQQPAAKEEPPPAEPVGGTVPAREAVRAEPLK